MSLILEINQMRNNMGLTPMNESHFLNEANSLKGIAKLIDDVIKLGKVVFTTAEKSALDKFIVTKNIDDFLKDELNSKTLKNFVNSTNGKEFLEDLGELIAKEPDVRKRVGYNAYVDALKELPTKKSIKDVTKEIVSLDKLVNELTDYSKLEIRRDDKLFVNLKNAKTQLSRINGKQITKKLPQDLQDEIWRLGEVIKSKNPGLWSEIKLMFPSLKSGWKNIGPWGRLIVIILASGTSLGTAIMKLMSPTLKQGICNWVNIPYMCDGVSTPDNQGGSSTEGGENKVDWSKYK